MLWRNGCDGKVFRCGAGNRHQHHHLFNVITRGSFSTIAGQNLPPGRKVRARGPNERNHGTDPVGDGDVAAPGVGVYPAERQRPCPEPKLLIDVERPSACALSSHGFNSWMLRRRVAFNRGGGVVLVKVIVSLLFRGFKLVSGKTRILFYTFYFLFFFSFNKKSKMMS